jgi:hypothetical protein
MILIDAVILSKPTPSSPTSMTSVPMQAPVAVGAGMGAMMPPGFSGPLAAPGDSKSMMIGIVSSIIGGLIVALSLHAYYKNR